MSGRTKAAVRARMLVWGRESAGYSREEVAEKNKWPVERVIAWESGDDRPSVAQAEKLAHLYDRPVGIFYLPEPPMETALPADFRFGAGGGDRGLNPAIRKEVRRIRSLRDSALHLAEDLDETDQQFPPLGIRARLDESPELVAKRARKWLAVSVEEQMSWHDWDRAFREWRDALEAKGVLVFVSMGKVPVAEMRGFCLVDERAPTVVVNNFDAKSAQVFTVFHEVGHLLLREESICLNIDFDPEDDSRGARIETWCNKFAGAFLVPSDATRLIPQFEALSQKISDPRVDTAQTDSALREIARSLSVSPEVVVRRMTVLTPMPVAAYVRWRQGWYERHPIRRPASRPGSSGPSWSQLAIYRLGMSYLRLVFSAYWSDAVTLRDLCAYVGAAKVETVQRLESRFKDRLYSSME